MRMINKILIMLNLIFLLLNCDYKFNNPVDPDIKIPAPNDLQLSQDKEWIKLSWKTSNSYDIDYEVFRRQGNSEWFNIANIENDESFSFLDTTVHSNILYQYKIRGSADENKSGYSMIDSLEAKFSAPYDIQCSYESENSLKLTWQDSCEFETGFKIYRKLSDGNAWNEIADLNATATSYIDSELLYLSNYLYYIICYTEHNESLVSSEFPAQIALTPPSNLVVTPRNDHEIIITWLDNSKFESGFIVERRAGILDRYKEIANVDKNQISCIDDSVKTDIEYAYRVKAYSENHESVYSNQVGVKTEFPAPLDLRINPINSYSAEIRWTDNCSYETGYILKYVVDDVKDTTSILLPANSTQYTFDDIFKEKIYSIMIHAYTDINKSKPLTGKIRFGNSYSIHEVSGLSGNKVNSTDFSADGLMVAFGREGNVCNIWNTESWTAIQSVEGNLSDQAANIIDVAFGHNNSILALGNATGSTRILSDDGWSELDNVYLNAYSLNACNFSADDANLAVAQYKFIYLWNTDDWSYSKTLSDHTDQINEIEFSLNGRWLASGGNDEQIIIYSVEDWSKLYTLTDHNAGVSDICFSPNSQFMISGSADGQIFKWTTDTWTYDLVFDEASAVNGLTISANNSWLATACDGSNQIKIWSTTDWSRVQTLIAEYQQITALQYSPDNNWLIATYENGNATVWNVEGEWILDQ